MRLRSSFIDQLESRICLAATATLSADGLLRVVGTNSGDPVTGGADDVDVGLDGSNAFVLLNGKTFDFPKSKVKSLLVETGSEADIISASLQVPTTLRGGAGEDYVAGTCSKTIVLTDYMDTVVLYAGGVYKYQWEGPGHSPKKISFDGVCGGDQGAGPQVSISANVPGFPSFLGGLGYVPNLTLSFTPGDDTLNFNASGFPIRLDMAGGNDQALVRNPSSKSAGATLFGGSGDDTLTSEGAGSFVLNGSAGNDTLISSPDASDKLIGGPGTDTAVYSARKRALRITLDNQPNDGQSGEHDNVMSDVENVIGGSGNDRIIGSPFNNSLVGGGGNDTIYGGAGNDTLVGGAGHDLLFGQDGNDLLLGKDGVKDSLDGGLGVDKATRDNGPSVFDIVKNIEAFI